jgi:hypothetical protein
VALLYLFSSVQYLVEWCSASLVREWPLPEHCVQQEGVQATEADPERSGMDAGMSGGFAGIVGKSPIQSKSYALVLLPWCGRINPWYWLEAKFTTKGQCFGCQG